jgi:predicted phage-related endonuclease
MNTEEIQQGTQDWIDARLGKVTASRIHCVMAKPRRKGQTESTTRANYMAQLAIEILTGKSAEDGYENWNMQRGIKLEPEARSEYELRVSEIVTTAGFIEHPRIARAGCSPDALVGSKGLAQFKCPIPRVHGEYVKLAKIKKVPPEYYPQVQFELACTGRERNDFVSYNDRFPEHNQLVIVRAERDEPYIKELEAAVIEFNAEVDELVKEWGA